MPLSRKNSSYYKLVENGYSTIYRSGNDNIIELTEKELRLGHELSKEIQMKIFNQELPDDKKLEMNINNFLLKISGLEKYFLYIYLTIKRKKKNEFSSVEIAFNLKIKRIRITIQQELIDNNYIDFVGLKGRSKIYKLTEKGRNKVFELIEKYYLI